MDDYQERMLAMLTTIAERLGTIDRRLEKIQGDQAKSVEEVIEALQNGELSLDIMSTTAMSELTNAIKAADSMLKE